jgi:DNA-binding winged helix-turn-helix (wHTH) protein
VLEPHTARGVVYSEPYEVDLCVGVKYAHRIRLQDQPFRVLQILLEHPGRVVTREQLQKKIWPSDTFLDFDRRLRNAVKRPREALGDSAETPRYMETWPKRGCRFIGDAEARSGDSPAKKTTNTIGVRKKGFVEKAKPRSLVRAISFAALGLRRRVRRSVMTKACGLALSSLVLLFGLGGCGGGSTPQVQPPPVN